MATRVDELVTECKRQVENCLYTSTSLYIWLRWRRSVRVIFIVLPLILGSFATWELVKRSDSVWMRYTASMAAFVAGLLPGIYAALKYDDDLEACKLSAAEFKNLQDRFRQVAIISSRKPFAQFEADFQAAMARMEKARQVGLTPPERFFKKAQKKVKSQDYDFDVDLKTDDANGIASAPPTPQPLAAVNVERAL